MHGELGTECVDRQGLGYMAVLADQRWETTTESDGEAARAIQSLVQIPGLDRTQRTMTVVDPGVPRHR